MRKTFFPSMTPRQLGLLGAGILIGVLCTVLSIRGNTKLAGVAALLVPLAAEGMWRPKRLAQAYKTKGWALPAAVTALALAGMMALEMVTVTMTEPRVVTIAKALGKGAVLSLLLTPPFCLCLQRLRQRAARFRGQSDRPGFPAGLFFLALLIPMGLYWSTNFPYGFSFDLEYQLSMLRGDIPLNDVHTPAHTFLLWLTGSRPTLLIAGQMAVLAAFLTGCAGWLYRRGVGMFGVTAMAFVYSLSQAAGWSVIAPLKDLPAAICCGAVLYFIMRTLEEDAPLSWLQMLGFGAALAFAGLFRHNGLVLVVVAGVWLVARGIRRRRKVLLGAAAVCAACIFLVDGVAYTALNIQSPKNGFAVQVCATGIVAVDRRGGRITPEQRQRMEQLLPMDYVNYCLGDPANAHRSIAVRLCWNRHLQSYVPSENEQQFVPLLEDPDGSKTVFNNLFILACGENQKQIVKLYLELFLQNPWLCIVEILCNTTSIWRFDGGLGLFSHVIYLIGILLAFVWQGGKRMLRCWPALLPVACNIASVVVAASTNEIRYLLPTFLLAAPMVLYFAVSEAGATDKKQENAQDRMACRV